jgi:NodT family efflux transporter outer membrane factor (OMF) lipoprotein
MKTGYFTLPATLALLSGCVTLGPDYTAPTPTDPRLTSIVDAPEYESVAGTLLEARWWDRFNDPRLTALIETAAAANTDVRLAVFRIEEARAGREIVRSRRGPSVGGSSSALRSQASETSGGLGPPPGAPSLQNLFDLSLNLNWEADLFGRLGRLETASDALIEASEEDRRAILVAVFAEVGVAYAELRGLQVQETIARENITIAARTVELTSLLVEQDLAPEFDLVRARAELTELSARINPLLAGQHAAMARIAFLTGQEPAAVSAALLSEGPQLIPSARIPVGLPSDILRRRPDIRAAERRLAAASEQIGIEMADLLPSFGLTGTAGLASANVEDLFETSSQLWSVGGLIRWPIFDGGAERGEIDIARSRFGAAGAQYDAAILQALSELETALAAYVYAARELDELRAARTDRQRAYDLAILRYQTNADSLFPALDASRRLTALNADIAAREQDLLIAEINVYRALGGGWESFEPAEPAKAVVD